MSWFIKNCFEVHCLNYEEKSFERKLCDIKLLSDLLTVGCNPFYAFGVYLAARVFGARYYGNRRRK